MELEEFKALGTSVGLSPVLQALWWDARGDWARSHAVSQDVEGPDGVVVHATLHRKECDVGNAAYWYRRAGRATDQAQGYRSGSGLRIQLRATNPAQGYESSSGLRDLFGGG